MSESREKPRAARDMRTSDPRVPYEPPRVERLLTQEDLEREVLYGGTPGPSPVEW